MGRCWTGGGEVLKTAFSYARDILAALMRLRNLLLISLFAAPLAASLVSAQSSDPGLRTVRQANANPTGYPPRGGSWSPDSRLYTFPASDDKVANATPGDIVAVEAATGRAFILVTAAQLAALPAPQINEKDADHRNRYSMSSYLWADDSKHLIIDNGGPIYLWDIAKAKGTLVVDTHNGSGADPKFSPDAKSVSYLRDHNLYVHPVAAGAEIALTKTAPETLLNGEVDWVYLEEMEVRSNYFWSPDSQRLAYLQMDEAKVPQYPITDYVPVHATVDYQRFPQPGDPNPAVRVGVVSAAGGATRFIEIPFSQNNDYVPRFGWVDAKTLYAEVLARDHQHLKLYFADAATGRVKLIHEETDAKYLEDNYDVTFLPHGKFFFTSWKTGHTQLYVYGVDPEHPLAQEAVLISQLTRGDFEFMAPEVHGAAIFVNSNESGLAEQSLYAIAIEGSLERSLEATAGSHETVNADGTRTTTVVADDFSIAVDKPERRRLTPSAGTHDTSISPDGTHFVDIASTDTTPPTASLCSTATTACKPFWQSNPIAAAAGVSTRRVTFTAADGKTPLYGVLTEPANAKNKSVPIILNPYGGPIPYLELKNTWSYSQLFDEVLAQHGFAVLHVENRGQGGRGRDFEQANYRNFGPVQFSDQITALDQLLAADKALDPARVGWWGWSWGGTFTLYAMTHTDRIKAGVAVAPNGDFRDYDTIYTERYLGLPSENRQAYDTASNVLNAGKLKGRILLAQGTGDDNVHMANTLQLLDPLIEAGIPYDLQLFPRKTHSIAGYPARNELFERILAHFETYLK